MLRKIHTSRVVVLRNLMQSRSFQVSKTLRSDDKHSEHNKHHDSKGENNHHDEHGEPFTDEDGRIFSVAKGAKYKARAWEYGFLPLFYGSMFVLFIGLALKPDYRIKTWSREELLRRKKQYDAEGDNNLEYYLQSQARILKL